MRFHVSQPPIVAFRATDSGFSVPVKFGNIQYVRDTSGMEVYKGETEVIPKVDEEIILETREKLMPDNVTVHQLPIHRTANSSGGTTVWIGGIIDA